MNLQLETTNHCNLACVECPHRMMNRKKTHMTDEIFEKVLQEYIIPLKDESEERKILPTVILHKDGEPLMHPKIGEFIERIAAVRPDCKIDIYTNGLLLTQDFVKKLSRLNNQFWIMVSFHFFSYMGRFIEYWDTMNELGFILRENYSNIEFIFSSHVTRFAKEEDLDRWAKFWVGFVDDHKVKSLRGVNVNKHINPWTGLIQEDNMSTFDTCPYMDFGHLFIGCTGNVLPCCMVLEEEIKFGNVMVNSVKEIFENVEKFYTDMQQGKIREEICKECLREKPK